MNRDWILLLFLLILRPFDVGAETTFRGSVAVLEASPKVHLSVLGYEGSSFTPVALPQYLPGLFSATGTQEDYLFLRTSNRMNLFFEGAGFFAVERFEYVAESDPSVSEELKVLQSRMILNLRKGLLLVDCVELCEESQLFVEAPFGQVAGSGAKWFIEIALDPRSGIYGFTIACQEGLVRLTDLRGEVYLIYPGQRLAGAGSSSAPAIEVGEPTDHSRQLFKNFEELLMKHDMTKLDHAALRQQMLVLGESTAAESALTDDSGAPKSNKRPVVIEFSPRAPELTPFRGEVCPPSDAQVDLF
ncbi:MAG: hypothetical protein AAF065_09650 [Verrucomicrobiota bacterium]